MKKIITLEILQKYNDKISQIIDNLSAVKGQHIIKSITQNTDLLFKTADLTH